MSLVTLADHPVRSGRITLVANGAWSARLVVVSDVKISGSVRLVATDGIDLTCYVRPSSSGPDAANDQRVMLIGGAGGLEKKVKGSYRSAKLTDPVQRAVRAAGDSLDASVSTALLSRQIAQWTCEERSVLFEYCALAREAGADVHWRYLPNGKLWIGEETWPAMKLPEGTKLEDFDPSTNQWLLAVDTPAILPGVSLEGIGNVMCVDHWISSDKIRSVVWT